MCRQRTRSQNDSGVRETWIPRSSRLATQSPPPSRATRHFHHIRSARYTTSGDEEASRPRASAIPRLVACLRPNELILNGRDRARMIRGDRPNPRDDFRMSRSDIELLARILVDVDSGRIVRLLGLVVVLRLREEVRLERPLPQRVQLASPVEEHRLPRAARGLARTG